MSDDLEEFKKDYPGAYQKFLEMNRALAKIQRRLEVSGRSKDNDLPDGGDLPNMLEWE